MSLIQLEKLAFNYKADDAFSLKLDRFIIEKSRRIFIEGPSGCGKTTFLNLLTGLLSPATGHIRILGTDITTLSQTKRDRFRADHFGIIFQLFNLIPYLSVSENILLPCMFSTLRKRKALTQSSTLEIEAERLCESLHIDQSLLVKPVQNLSIGQQQRVAIARALIGQPEIIVADEPTSALDDDRKRQFMSVLLEACERYAITLVFVSHDNSLKTHFEEIYNLSQINTAYSELPHVPD